MGVYGEYIYGIIRRLLCMGIRKKWSCLYGSVWRVYGDYMGVYGEYLGVYLWDGYEIDHARNDLVLRPRQLWHRLSTTNKRIVIERKTRGQRTR